MTNKLKYLTVLGVVLVAASVWVFLSGTHAWRSKGVSEVAQAKVNLRSDDNARVNPNTISVPMRAGQPKDAYDSANNLQFLINEVASKPSYSADLDLIKAKAWDECGLMIHNPQAIDGEIASLTTNGGKYADYRIAALRKLKSRCRDFAFGAGNMTRLTASALYTDAQAGGSSEAIAMELAKSVSSLPPEQAKSDVLKIIGSGDPAALFAVSGAFGVDGPFQATPGGEVGTNLSQYAWQLVACDAGKDCSAGSAIVMQSCLYLGICGPGDYRVNLQYSAFPPSDFQLITQAEGRISAAIADGTVRKFLIHK